MCPKINEYSVQKTLGEHGDRPSTWSALLCAPSFKHPLLRAVQKWGRMGSRKEERGTSAASNQRLVCCSLVTNGDPPLQKEAFQYPCSLQLFFLALKQKQNSLFTHCSSAPVLPTPLYLFVWSPRCVAPAPSKSPYNLQLNLAVYSEASAGEITQLGLILSAAEFCGSS